MKNFDSLLSDISITKILNFFGYRLSATSPKYNTYTKANYTHSFFIFNDADSDSIQVFSGTLYKKLTKTELLFFISGADTLTTAVGLVPKVAEFPALDNNANLSAPVTVNSLINLLAALVEPDSEILPIIKTPQFKRRVFLTPDGYYKTPLFFHHLDQATSNRIVNFVKWNDAETHYFNSNSFCLNASFYTEANKFLFVTCSPGAWISFPTLRHSPDYFQLLCHPQAPVTMFDLLYSIFKKYMFLKCYFHIGTDPVTNAFSVKSLSFFINQLSPKFFFDISFSSDRYFIQISYFNNRELNIELAKLFSAVSFDVHEHFFSGYQDQFELPEDVSALTSFQSEKIVVGEKVTIVESISGQRAVALTFFNVFLRHLKLDQQLEVISL